MVGLGFRVFGCLFKILVIYFIVSCFINLFVEDILFVNLYVLFLVFGLVDDYYFSRISL